MSVLSLCLLLSCVWLFATLWPVAHQAPLSLGFSRQGYWGGLPFPSPGDLPDPGLWVFCISGGFISTWATWEALVVTLTSHFSSLSGAVQGLMYVFFCKWPVSLLSLLFSQIVFFFVLIWRRCLQIMGVMRWPLHIRQILAPNVSFCKNPYDVFHLY